MANIRHLRRRLLAHAEPGAIATQLGVHPDVPLRVIGCQGKNPRIKPAAPSAVAP